MLNWRQQFVDVVWLVWKHFCRPSHVHRCAKFTVAICAKIVGTLRSAHCCHSRAWTCDMDCPPLAKFVYLPVFRCSQSWFGIIDALINVGVVCEISLFGPDVVWILLEFFYLSLGSCGRCLKSAHAPTLANQVLFLCVFPGICYQLPAWCTSSRGNLMRIWMCLWTRMSRCVWPLGGARQEVQKAVDADLC